MKRPTLLIVILMTFPFSHATEMDSPRLKISNSGHHLVYENETPFFYLADTAWSLFSRLDKDEIEFYLNDRSAKGFTVIQTVVLLYGAADNENRYGHTVLHEKDPYRPNESFFELVDYTIERAEARGMFVALLPTWGSHWSSENEDHVFDEDSAYFWGAFLGKRYKNNQIIWVLGGDQTIKNDEERKIIDSMAKGLKAGDGGWHLLTFHPRRPGSASREVADADWIDFYMHQSSHSAHDHDNGMFIDHDYALTPVKPTLDGECKYEALQVGFYFEGNNRLDRFDDYDCRQAAYWAMLAGACGHAYGHNSVFQMWEPGMPGVFGVNIAWKDALDHPGAFQMGIMKEFFESMAWQKLIPCQRLVKDGPTFRGAKIRAALANDNSFAVIYSPRGEPFTIDQRMISGLKHNEYWFNPKYGFYDKIMEPDTIGFQTYTPPTSGRGNDWVLIVEDASHGSTNPIFPK